MAQTLIMITFVFVLVAFTIVIVVYRVARRFYSTRRDMRWSKEKGMVAYGPPPLRHHFIFVDKQLNVAVFLPKQDGTLHVMTGTLTRAEHATKYNEHGETIGDGEMKDAPDWKITRTGIRYRGGFLSRQDYPHNAEIHSFDQFTRSVDPQFIDKKAKELLHHMNEKGELPMRAT